MRPPLPLFLLLIVCSVLSARAAAPAPAPVQTVIECDGPSEMASSATETVFTFRDRVRVTGSGLVIACDALTVVATRTGDLKATLGKQENFKSLVATGHVRILQGNREALCGRAEVLPGEDKVTLDDKPIVRLLDGSYEASGPRMILYRGQLRAEIVPLPGQPGPKFILPEIKDLGFDKNKVKPKPADEPAKTP